MIKILFDIETVATDRAREFVEKKIYDLPKNLLSTADMPSSIRSIKSDEKREGRYREWQVEQREKIKRHVALNQLKDLEKAALYWWSSKVISIAWVHVHLETFEIVSDGCVVSEVEDDVISKFYDASINSPYEVAGVIGKNSKNFDIPYLIGRTLALNLGIPDFLRATMSRLGDIDEIFGSLSARNSQITTLENYAFGLGIEGKMMDGSRVETLYKNGDLDTIGRYNIDDVRILLEIYRRWRRRYK